MIYINQLPNDLQPNSKLFETLVIVDVTTSTGGRNSNLLTISEWEVQWKADFNPIPWKQAQELLLSQK